MWTMWDKNWRKELWSGLERPWDVIVIGGGITGAGILREATRLGLRVLLVEQRDFAYGTSSRSSKLVHGGLRYLKEGKVGLTLAAVRQRQHLLEEGGGLIKPLGFLLAGYEGDKTAKWLYQAGLSLYDLLAWQWSHRSYDRQDFQMLAPHLAREGLKGGFGYGDAQTDDARLVFRLIQEATAAGGTAINYVTAESLLRDPEDGRVQGICLRDEVIGARLEVNAAIVVNATGAWADRLRGQVGGVPRVRPLRGSHLIFPEWRLPVAQAISFPHPADRRHIFIVPWEGVTLVGTTDIDHRRPLDEEPRISAQEVAYLMAAVTSHFPSLNLTLDDITATFAGVRPVIGSGKADPSHESRDHVIWEEAGLLTVTGGKLTTFQIIAHDLLRVAGDQVPFWVEDPHSLIDDAGPALDPVNSELPSVANQLDGAARHRLTGRYGHNAAALVNAARRDELAPIPGTETLWAELRWAARAEAVVHLDDLLLRRVRLGLLLPDGGAAHMARIRAICQAELGWDDGRWQEEETAYLARWQRNYSLPPREQIPDWRPAAAQTGPIPGRLPTGKRQWRRPVAAAGLAGTALLLTLLYWWREPMRET